MRFFHPLQLLVLLFLMATFFESCQDDALGDPIIVSNVKKEFYFNIWEELTVGYRFVHFDLETIKDGECLNGEISYDFTRSANNLKLTLNEVVLPEDCIPGIAPSTARVSVGYLENGYYPFELSLRNTVVNKGHLSANQDRYTIYLETEEGFILLNKTLRRVPEDIFWGYVAYDADNQTAIADEVLTNLETLGNIAILEKGFYGYFNINSSVEGIEIKDSPQTAHLRPFIFSYNNEWDEVKDIGDAFNAANPDMTLKIFNDIGQVF